MNEAPEKEQEICVGCGFCCDGTLFGHAVLKPGERGLLPEKIEESAYSEGEKDYFRLPCGYFSEKCTIYDRERADVCGSYRCQLLRDFAGNKITLEEAMDVIKEARSMRGDLLEQFRRFSGNNDKIHFKKILRELGRFQNPDSEKEPLNMDYEMLLGRCNIFEALMIKHFRSASDFGKMQITNEDKKEQMKDASV